VTYSFGELSRKVGDVEVGRFIISFSLKTGVKRLLRSRHVSVEWIASGRIRHCHHGVLVTAECLGELWDGVIARLKDTVIDGVVGVVDWGFYPRKAHFVTQTKETPNTSL